MIPFFLLDWDIIVEDGLAFIAISPIKGIWCLGGGVVGWWWGGHFITSHDGT
jgi:hypothetical protein